MSYGIENGQNERGKATVASGLTKVQIGKTLINPE